jgi:3-oxoacyl-[acyl-carrier-protein] synthase-3
MAQSIINGVSIRGVASAVPAYTFSNVRDTTAFSKEEVRKVVAMAGVVERRIADASICSTDLCVQAAETLLDAISWPRESIDGLIMVTQTPDYFMPSSSCVIHKRLALSDRCAAFDVGLGCSGYIYGLWLAAMMLKSGGLKRVLLLHGETPTRYADHTDRAVSLLFGDAGSATALEGDARPDSPPWHFTLHTDGNGYDDLIVPAGGFRDRFCADRASHFVRMNGANVFNFSIKVIPPLIADTLRLAQRTADDVDYFVFHQSNKFIIEHLINTCGLRREAVPMILDRFGNAGGPSVPLTITQGIGEAAGRQQLSLMLLGYGAGLSWGAALLPLPEGAAVRHVECDAPVADVR